MLKRRSTPTPAPEPSPLDALQAAVTQRSAALLDEAFTPEADVVVHGVSGWSWAGGPERQAAWSGLFSSVPDLTYRAQRRYLSPEMHSEEGRFSGTLQPADGTAGEAPFSTSVRLVARLEGDRVARLEVWGDAAGLPTPLLPLVTAAAAGAGGMSVLRGQAQPTELRVLGSAHDDRVQAPTVEVATAAAAAPAAEQERRRRPRWVLAAAGMVVLAVLAGLGVLAVARGGSAPGPRDTVAADTSTDASTAPEPSAEPSPPTDAGSAAPEIEPETPATAPSVQAGEQLVLASDVLFETGSTVLSPEAVQALTDLATSIREREVTGTVQINGYTDNTGSDAFDLDLSRARAQAVAQVLQGALAGVPVRLQPQGFGKANPVADNGSPEGRAQNRRVTIVLPERPE